MSAKCNITCAVLETGLNQLLSFVTYPTFKYCKNVKLLSIVSGNIGIAKYLLDQPGVNINEVNDNGDTILLSVMKEGCETALDQNFVLQIEELVIVSIKMVKICHLTCVVIYLLNSSCYT
jgi:hypothetical protein